MHIRIGQTWQKLVRAIVRHPAVEVIAAIVLVLLAAWFVIATEAERHAPLFPTVFGQG